LVPTSNGGSQNKFWRVSECLKLGLVIESLAQGLALGTQIWDLSFRQLQLGLPLSFGLYFVGTVLPAMIFIYAILVPRYLKLTESTATTVILGGLTYTLMHLWDAWTVFTSPNSAALSVVFLLFMYFGPGMMKTVLTLRTSNAWGMCGPITLWPRTLSMTLR
jgi:hypothetical protein